MLGAASELLDWLFHWAMFVIKSEVEGSIFTIPSLRVTSAVDALTTVNGMPKAAFPQQVGSYTVLCRVWTLTSAWTKAEAAILRGRVPSGQFTSFRNVNYQKVQHQPGHAKLLAYRCDRGWYGILCFSLLWIAKYSASAGQCFGYLCHILHDVSRGQTTVHRAFCR